MILETLLPEKSKIQELEKQLASAKDVKTVKSLSQSLIAAYEERWSYIGDFDIKQVWSEIYQLDNKRNTGDNLPDNLYQQLKTKYGQNLNNTEAKQMAKTLLSYDIIDVDSAVKTAKERVDGNTEQSHSVITATRDDNGAYVLTEPADTVTVKNNQSKTDTSKLNQDPDYLDRRPAWIDTNIEYHRTKTNDGFMVDSAYIKRYYSVIDAEIYFGNEYVEDVCNIDWAIRQNVMPLFGYNSYTYDEVSRGSRLIIGSFAINFTSPNYLFSILAEANKKNIALVSSMTDYTVPALSSSVKPKLNGKLLGSKERGHHTNMWPQTFDIDIIFGEKTGAGNPVHIILLGCAINSCQIALSASTAQSPPVVLEQYNFIAQDIRTVVVADNDKTDADIKQEADENTGQEDIAEDTSVDVETVTDDDTPSWAKFRKEQEEAEKKRIAEQLANLGVSNENKEMARYYKEQQEKQIPSWAQFRKDDAAAKADSNIPVFGAVENEYMDSISSQAMISTNNETYKRLCGQLYLAMLLSGHTNFKGQQDFRINIKGHENKIYYLQETNLKKFADYYASYVKGTKYETEVRNKM